VFHKAMSRVLEGLYGTYCFINDVSVWGSSQEEHDRRLRQVLDQFKSHGVQLQPSKCHFRLTEVTYNGHVLSGKGVAISKEKLRAITDMKRPESKRRR
jgi:hypothetical protein